MRGWVLSRLGGRLEGYQASGRRRRETSLIFFAFALGGPIVDGLGGLVAFRLSPGPFTGDCGCIVWLCCSSTPGCKPQATVILPSSSFLMAGGAVMFLALGEVHSRRAVEVNGRMEVFRCQAVMMTGHLKWDFFD